MKYLNKKWISANFYIQPHKIRASSFHCLACGPASICTTASRQAPTLSSLKPTAKTTRVSHDWAEVRPTQVFLSGCPAGGCATLDRRSRPVVGATDPRRGAAPGPGPALGPIPGSADTGSESDGPADDLSSPRKSRRTRARRYQAFGKARVSESLKVKIILFYGAQLPSGLSHCVAEKMVKKNNKIPG